MLWKIMLWKYTEEMLKGNDHVKNNGAVIEEYYAPETYVVL